MVLLGNSWDGMPSLMERLRDIIKLRVQGRNGERRFREGREGETIEEKGGGGERGREGILKKVGEGMKQ